jgi:hypothetical protein
MPIATFPPGTVYNLPLQICQMDGVTPSGAYLASDTLTTELWAGVDQQLLATPAAAWNLAIGVPAFTVNFQPSDTASLGPGTYRLVVNITRANSTFEVYRDSIELSWTPQVFTRAIVTAQLTGGMITGFTVVSGGSGYPPNSSTIPVTLVGGFGYGAIATASSNTAGVIVAVNLVPSTIPGVTTGGIAYQSPPTVTVGAIVPPTYCTLQDMQNECTWIEQYMDQDHNQSGFLQQRGLARRWFDRLLLASWPGARVTYIQDGWPSNYGQFTLISNPWLVAGLAQGFLMVPPLYQTPRAYEAVEVNALYSIALVLRSQMGPTSGIEKYAGYFMRRAQAAAAQCTAELDINGDGLCDIAIPLSVTNTRRG